MNRKFILIGLIFSLSFLVLCSFFYDFVIDDAYIIFRYSLNLVRGFGLTWNPGEDPVEGYTSFLWVLLNAGALFFHADPVIFSRAFSLLAGLSVIWLLAWTSRDLPWPLASIIGGAFGLNPAYALLTMQGLETTLTGFLVLLAGFLSLRICLQPTRAFMAWWSALMVVAFLARPDTAVFFAANFLGLLAIKLAKKDFVTIKKFVIIGLPFFAMILIYMWWRVRYFGYFFPNTFYLKVASREAYGEKPALLYLSSFFQRLFWPYLTGFVVWGVWRFNREKFVLILPILTGVIMFGLYLLFIVPIQGFAWRYIFPVMPVFFLAGVIYFSGAGEARGPRLWGWVVLAVGFWGWSVRLLPVMQEVAAERTSRDRVLVGKRLAGIPGVMFTTESGALPYFSGWRSADFLGLTSEEIAHHGLSEDFLARLNPDLVITLESQNYNPHFPRREVLSRYLVRHGFVAVAAIHKAKAQYHFYFVREDSRFFGEIVAALLGIPEVSYGDLEEQMAGSQIPIYEPGFDE